MSDDLSVLERQEQEALAALNEEFPGAEIVTPGCDQRYAVRLGVVLLTDPTSVYTETQWWEEDTLPAVRQRIVWALANR